MKTRISASPGETGRQRGAMADAVPSGREHGIGCVAVEPTSGDLVPQRSGSVDGAEGGPVGSVLAEGVVGICGRYHTGWQRKVITANPMGIT